MNNKTLSLILTIFFLSASLVGFAQTKYITVDGKTRSYLVYVPQNLGAKRPLLISCHGMNQDAAYQKNMLTVESVADKEKFVTVFPQGEGNAWDISGSKDLNFIKAIINKMVTDYDIDRDRVYMSGFSMGGMLTYHCMNNLSDIIAAFAPISGYPMYGFNCTAKRPIPVIHTHGTSDDVCVFSGVQGNIDKLIAFNKCSTKATVTTNYKGYGHITRREWAGGTGGVKVVLMELANKGHWVSNDGFKTVQGIWDFCKDYTLKSPVEVNITSPKEGDKVGVGFKLAGTATSTRGDITKITVFKKFNTGSLSKYKEITGTSVFDVDFENMAEGTYQLAVRADDNQGNYNNSRVNFTVINDPSTGMMRIENVEVENDATIYDLNGQIVGNMQTGKIYIRNGKKILK